MRVAISNQLLRDRSFVEQCETAAALGYQGLEISPYTVAPKGDANRLDPAYGEYLLDTAQFHGLSIVGLNEVFVGTDRLNDARGFHLNDPDDDLRRETLNYLKHLAKLCYAMEGKVLLIGSPAQRNLLTGWSVDECAYRTADLLRELAEYCAPLGLTIGITPLPHYQTNFLTSARETTILLNIIDHPNCKLHLGTRELSYELDPNTPGTPTPKGVTPNLAQVEEYMSHLIRFHKNRLCHMTINERQALCPGQSQMTHQPYAQALHDIGYDGWATVDGRATGEVSPNQFAEAAISFVRSTYPMHTMELAQVS